MVSHRPPKCPSQPRLRARTGRWWPQKNQLQAAEARGKGSVPRAKPVRAGQTPSRAGWGQADAEQRWSGGRQ